MTDNSRMDYNPKVWKYGVRIYLLFVLGAFSFANYKLPFSKMLQVGPFFDVPRVTLQSANSRPPDPSTTAAPTWTA